MNYIAGPPWCYSGEESTCQCRGHRLHLRFAVCAQSLQPCPTLYMILWTVAFQASLSMGFSRQEHWSGLPSPPAGYLLDPGIEPTSSLSPALQAESLLLSGPEKISNAKMPRGNEAQAPQLLRLCAPTTEALEPVFCHQGKQPQ